MRFKPAQEDIPKCYTEFDEDLTKTDKTPSQCLKFDSESTAMTGWCSVTKHPSRSIIF